MAKQVLRVTFGGDARESLLRAARTMEAIERGRKIAPHAEIGFEDMGQMLGVLTPKRWELLAVLRESGPMSVAALARKLGRDYKNVHGDVEKLIEWMAVERDDAGRVFAPFAEIVVDVRLPAGEAAE